MKRLLLLAIGAFLTVGVVVATVLKEERPELVIDRPQTQAASSSPAGNGASAQAAAAGGRASQAQAEQLPRSVSIAVPFASQAPFANWGMPYQEACEEASLILVHYYLAEKTLSLEQMDRAILDLVAYEEQHGYPPDVTIAELARIAEDYYGYSTRILSDPTIDGIKAEIAKGNPVIVPLAGRDLGNPYYSGEGPWYHMLVITGFDSRNFITNDVGTKRGKGYTYRFNTLMNAIHDWTGVKEEIRQGKSVALVVEQ